MRKRTRTIKLLEDEARSSEVYSKSLGISAIRISSGHRTVRRDGEDYAITKEIEYVKMETLNQKNQPSISVYIPVSKIYDVIAALSTVKPIAPQLEFGRILSDDREESNKLITKLKLKATPQSIYRKEL